MERFLECADEDEANFLRDQLVEIMEKRVMTNATVVVALSLMVAELLVRESLQTPIMTVLNHLAVKFSNEMNALEN